MITNDFFINKPGFLNNYKVPDSSPMRLSIRLKEASLSPWRWVHFSFVDRSAADVLIAWVVKIENQTVCNGAKIRTTCLIAPTLTVRQVTGAFQPKNVQHCWISNRFYRNRLSKFLHFTVFKKAIKPMKNFFSTRVSIISSDSTGFQKEICPILGFDF